MYKCVLAKAVLEPWPECVLSTSTRGGSALVFELALDSVEHRETVEFVTAVSSLRASIQPDGRFIVPF
jgi:hypothetical protein